MTDATKTNPVIENKLAYGELPAGGYLCFHALEGDIEHAVIEVDLMGARQFIVTKLQKGAGVFCSQIFDNLQRAMFAAAAGIVGEYMNAEDDDTGRQNLREFFDETFFYGAVKAD